MTAVQVRDYREGDRPALARLFARADAHDRAARALSPSPADDAPLYAFAHRCPLGLERGLTRAEARARLGERLAAVERHLLVAADDAQLYACAAVYAAVAETRWTLDWVVDPDKRTAAPLDALLAAGLARIRQLACAPADSIGVEARLARDDAHARDALGRAGLTAARSFAILTCDLARARAPLPESNPAPSPGVALRSYRSGDAPAWIAAFNASFSDHWGGFTYTPESWGRHAASPRFREELSVVAVAGDAIVGVCHCAPSLNPLEQGLAHLHILGVRPQYRRHGLGRRLMAEGLRRLREGEFARVELDVDTLNAKALPLYAQLDFERQEEITIYRGEL